MKHAKTDIRYWQESIFRRRFKYLGRPEERSTTQHAFNTRAVAKPSPCARQIVLLRLHGLARFICISSPMVGTKPLPRMAGLRRNEIDKLQWTAFQWDRAVLRVDVTEHLGTKSEDSIGEVDLEPEMVEMFRNFHANSKSAFVITSQVAPRRKRGYSHYRCERVFASLNRWLRKNGVKGNFPLHSLRKEYGSRICDKLGIYAASQALRHADIAITSQHYIDKKRQVTAELGHLLAPARHEPK